VQGRWVCKEQQIHGLLPCCSVSALRSGCAPPNEKRSLCAVHCMLGFADTARVTVLGCSFAAVAVQAVACGGEWL
jgi:hypothetical protein